MAWYWFETLTNSCSQCSTLGKGNAKYGWLFDRTSVFGCETYGSSNNPIGINQYGYWTSSKPTGNFVYAWYVYLTGQTYFRYVDDPTYIGVRPVITVSKSKL